MEKVVFSKGYEFEIVTNGVVERSNELTLTFIPGAVTAEQLLSMCEGNSTIKIVVDETSVRKFEGFTKCSSVTVIPNYLIKTKFSCPECHTEVEPHVENCPNCNFAFVEGPEMEEIRDTVCTVKFSIPDINARMTDAEEAIDDIINEILG